MHLILYINIRPFYQASLDERFSALEKEQFRGKETALSQKEGRNQYSSPAGQALSSGVKSDLQVLNCLRYAFDQTCFLYCCSFRHDSYLSSLASANVWISCYNKQAKTSMR